MPRKAKEETPDRVSCSLKKTINIGGFNSVAVDYGLSSNVRPGETEDQAYGRITKSVETWLEKACGPIEDQLTTS